MRTPFVLTVAVALTLTGSASASAAATGPEPFPARPVRIIVPASAGGTLDIIARTLSPGMGEGLGQVVVVENRATASTTVAEEYVARATPDGHTMFMAGTSRATNPHLYTKLSYDPLRDLASVSLVATSGNALVVGPATPAKTVKELIELARSRPGELLYGTASSSIEVRIDVDAEDIPSGKKMESNSAYFTFVAVDQSGRPIDVPEVEPETEEEKAMYDGALRRRQLRLILAGRMKPQEANELRSIFDIKETQA